MTGLSIEKVNHLVNHRHLDIEKPGSRTPPDDRRSWWIERPLTFVLLLALVFGVIYGGGFVACTADSLRPSFVCQKALTQPWATVITGTLVLLGAVLTYLSSEKTRALSREALDQTASDAERGHQRSIEAALNDRFVTAVGQLGTSSEYTVRLGGAYSLIALAEDWVVLGEQKEESRTRARKQTQVCVDVLCSYLRSNSHRTVPESGVSGQFQSESRLRTEVFRMLFSTRGVTNGNSSSHKLSWTYLGLDEAFMDGADLRHIDGWCISLKGANFAGLNLSHSKWTFGSFQGAILDDVDLSAADLSGACLEGASLRSANLNRTELTEAHFDGVHLEGADLAGARGLSADQIALAHCWDDSTKWPEDLAPDGGTKRHSDLSGKPSF